MSKEQNLQSYNDATMMMATQVAYLNYNGEDMTVGELVDHILNEYGEKKNGEWQLKPEYKKFKCDGELEKQLEVAANIERIAQSTSGLDNWKDWKILDVCNDQNNTGFYGMLIDTGNGGAIIGCRGSESFDMNQIEKDWIVADVGLMDSELTTQQERGRQYIQYIWDRYGDKYHYSVTGHSLGGNLAEDMVIHAPEKMLQHIDRCISFDGPGYSQEYIDANKELIDRIVNSDIQMDHYQWSWVSSLLLPLPGIVDTVIKAHDDYSNYEWNKSITLNWIKAMLYRHDTHNVEFDENGNIIKGDTSFLSEICNPIVTYIEHAGEDMSLNELIYSLMPRNSLPSVFAFVCGLKIIKDVVISFTKIAEEVKEIFDNIYYDYIAPNVSGNFEIKRSYVVSCKQSIRDASKQLDSTIEEINSIRRNWKFQATSGSYYRSQLWLLQSGFESDKKKMDMLVAAAEIATNMYGSVDQIVASKFALFKKYEG